MSRVVLAVAMATALTIVNATAAFAASTYNDSVVGTEIFATGTLGVFVGKATGDLPGSWSAAVAHTALSGTPQSAAITGGSFALTTSDGAVTVLGSFTGGSVTQTGGFSACQDQTYAVSGSLGLTSPGAGTGAFNALLTHHRRSFFGHCITYAASVVGSVSLTY